MRCSFSGETWSKTLLLLLCLAESRSTPDAESAAAAAAQLDYTQYRAIMENSSIRYNPSQLGRSYFYYWWNAGLPHGVGCSKPYRLGSKGEAGKVVCNPDELLSARPCRVVSVGSNGDAAFEADVHERAPHCQLDTFDGTLVGEREHLRANIPSYVTFHPENWGANSSWQFDGRHIALLKLDCEGCELVALLNALGQWEIQQIVVEVHGCFILSPSRAWLPVRRQYAPGVSKPLQLLDLMHAFMMGLHSAGYRIFAKEPNILTSDGTCVEFSLIRQFRHS